MLKTDAPSPVLDLEALITEHVRQCKARDRARQPKPWANEAARRTTLRNLGMFYKAELDDLSIAGRNRVYDRLCRAAVLEAQRSDIHHPNHFAYNLPRHRSLLAAREAERLAIDFMFEPMAGAA